MIATVTIHKNDLKALQKAVSQTDFIIELMKPVEDDEFLIIPFRYSNPIDLFYFGVRFEMYK